MIESEPRAPVAGDIPVLWQNGAPCIDLRGIDEPPRPLIAIIELIERPDTGDEVRVIMDRDPIHLYPELMERGWSWHKEFIGSRDLRLTLTRDPPGTPGSGP
ncbi:MAG: DUF2249 domain-containing protein [Rhodospirillales bacterium]|nr:DUF2249 domain-containing protein [Rhodospirillales bacterium]